jgi:hypothetical protein
MEKLIASETNKFRHIKDCKLQSDQRDEIIGNHSRLPWQQQQVIWVTTAYDPGDHRRITLGNRGNHEPHQVTMAILPYCHVTIASKQGNR